MAQAVTGLFGVAVDKPVIVACMKATVSGRKTICKAGTGLYLVRKPVFYLIRLGCQRCGGTNSDGGLYEYGTENRHGAILWHAGQYCSKKCHDAVHGRNMRKRAKG